MIKITDRATETCIVTQAEGALSGDEIETLSDIVEAAIEKHGSVSIVIELLGGVRPGDFEAVKEDWEFAFDEYRKVRRTAFVGDHAWMKATTKLFGWATKAEERWFDAGQLDEAIAWACEGEASA